MQLEYEEDSKINLDPRIEWREKPNGKEHHVIVLLEGHDPLDRSKWKEQHEQLLDLVERFVDYFKDRVKEV